MNLTTYAPNYIANNRPINVAMLQRFIAFLDAKPRTVDTYGKAVKLFFAYMEAHQITQPAREDILAYRDLLKAEGKKSATIQVYITAIRLFFRWLSTEGLYQSIGEHIKGAKVATGHKKDYLTSAQAKALLGAVDTSTIKGKRDYALIYLLITTGLRTIEVERAQVEDMRTAGNNTVLYIQGKGKDDKSEYVKLSAPAEAAIRNYMKAANIKDPSAAIFQSLSNNSRGHAMTTRAIRETVNTYLEGANLKTDRLTAHSLRHTAVTLSLLGGLTLQEAQQFARHANITTTQIYAHNLEAANNRGAEIVTQSLL